MFCRHESRVNDGLVEAVLVDPLSHAGYKSNVNVVRMNISPW